MNVVPFAGPSPLKPEVLALRQMVRGVYDLQQLRIAAGLRLCANFRARLGLIAPPTQPGDEEAAAAAREAAEEQAADVIKELKSSFMRLTDGIARNRELPKRHGFTGDELINNYSELVIVKAYLDLEKSESWQFRQLEGLLEEVPIWNTWLGQQRGVGPAMGGVIIAYFDPYKARYASSFWKYAGLDVVHDVDGLGRSRRQEHLIDREYVARDGSVKTRRSVTFEPFLKTKLMGVLAISFIRQKADPWRDCYYGYKARINADPNKVKITTAEWKKMDPEERKPLWRPGRINDAAKRYMVKQFLAQLWEEWRRLEGLEVPERYHVAKLGMRAHGTGI